MRINDRFLSAVFCISLGGSVGWAQLTSATISGKVTDVSGSVLPDSDVSATDVATGAVAHIKTNEEGSYVLLGLSPDVYSLRISHDGFQSYEQRELQIAVGQRLVINAVLSVGTVGETINVTGGGGAAVNLESPMVSTSIDNQMTTQLPLNGRNILQLMQLAPDTSVTAVSSYQQSASRPDQANSYVGASGGRGDSTSYYLDGALNEDALTQIANVYPNPDAIQEFSFSSSVYSAKFSGRGGGVMNAVTRGGTNQFHGTLFEFVRNSAFNAINFFGTKPDGLKRHQFGGTIGGPIMKDKTFAFFSYQRTTVRQNALTTFTVPTGAQRNGDFSMIKRQLVDPVTGLPFAGNQIPTSRYDPISLKILQMLPAGDSTGVTRFLSRYQTNTNQFVTRIDQNLGSHLKLYGSYIYDSFQQPGNSIQGNLLSATTDQQWLSQFGVVNATYIFSPTLTTTLVGSFSRRTNAATSPAGFPGWSDLGVNVPNMVAAPHTSFYLAVSNYFTKTWNGFYTIPATEGGVGNQWTWGLGRHTLEFGGDVLTSKVIKNQDFKGNGYFVFSGGLSGDGALDFMLGKAATFNQAANFYYVPTRTLPALYVNDNWKIMHRLTLDLGLRWNPFVPVFDTAYREEALFDPEAYAANIHSKQYPTLPAGLLLAGDPTVPSRVIDSNYRRLNPRIGFALDVFGDGRTSLRGGYGMYQDQMTANTINPTFSPFSTSVTFTNPTSFANPYQGQVNPFPLPPGPAPVTTPFQIPMAANPMTRNMKAPVIQQWNLTTEQQIGYGTLLRLAYEGQNAIHLFGSVEGNAAIYDPTKTYLQNVSNYNIRRPMGSSYQSLPLGEDVGTSNYHALIVSVQRQATRGLTFLAGYRWSRCMNESEGAFFNANGYSTPNPKIDYGRCSYDVKNQFKGSIVWNVPPPHFTWAAPNFILSHWQMNGIVNLRGGIPFTVSSGIDNSTSGIGMDRADRIGNPSLPSGRNDLQKVAMFYNPAAFTVNALGTFGNTKRNFMIGPGYSNVDYSLVRQFPFGGRWEGSSLQFRAEAFNLLNHPNFSAPVSSVNSSSAGRIISTNGDARIIQLALKWTF